MRQLVEVTVVGTLRRASESERGIIASEDGGGGGRAGARRGVGDGSVGGTGGSLHA